MQFLLKKVKLKRLNPVVFLIRTKYLVKGDNETFLMILIFLIPGKFIFDNIYYHRCSLKSSKINIGVSIQVYIFCIENIP